MNANTRTARLRGEMMRRMSDGWNLIERSEFRMTMVHAVPPPAWRVALEVLNPLVWLLGGPTWAEVTRVLDVCVDEGGILHRVTTGHVPRGWRRRRHWEVADGADAGGEPKGR